MSNYSANIQESQTANGGIVFVPRNMDRLHSEHQKLEVKDLGVLGKIPIKVVKFGET